jgi:hypothetical protein
MVPISITGSVGAEPTQATVIEFLVNIQTDEQRAFVFHADLRMRGTTLSVERPRSCGSGQKLTRDKDLAEVSPSASESHTV